MKKLLEDYIPKYGKVKKIQSDHETQFTSPKWSEKLIKNRIQPIFSSIRHPRGNIVERVNKEIVRFLRTLLKKKHSGWVNWIAFIEGCLDSTYHNTTEFTPFEIHLNKIPERIWDKVLGIDGKQMLKIDEKIKIIANRIKTKGEKRTTKVNEGKHSVQYEIGEQVLVKSDNQSCAEKALVGKLLELYEGPYNVNRELFEETYEVNDPDTNNVRKNFHTNLIRPYFQDVLSNVKNSQADDEKKTGHSKNRGGR